MGRSNCRRGENVIDVAQTAAPAVEIEGRRLPLVPVDAKRNGKRKRPPRGEAPPPARPKTGFDPVATLVRASKKSGGAS